MTLTATPGGGYSFFAGWTGACSGGGTCAVAMSGNVWVTATFDSSSACAGNDASCVQYCSYRADELGRAAAPPPPFTSWRCYGVPWEYAGGTGCACTTADGDVRWVADVPNPCLVRGRDGACLWRQYEFPGCDLANPVASCETVCSELHARLAADAARVIDATMQLVACAAPVCSCLLRVGTSCHIAEDGTELACDAGLDTLRFMPWLTTRDLLEWPGMGVDLKNHPICPSPEWCGLALGCRNGYCGPCSSDADCAVGETCMLEHCLRESNVACKSASECGSPGEAWCIMNGVTGNDPRGNSELVSACTDFTGPSPFVQ